MSKRLTASLIRQKIRVLNNRIDLQIVAGKCQTPSYRRNCAEHKTLLQQHKKLTWQPK